MNEKLFRIDAYRVGISYSAYGGRKYRRTFQAAVTAANAYFKLPASIRPEGVVISRRVWLETGRHAWERAHVLQAATSVEELRATR